MELYKKEKIDDEELIRDLTKEERFSKLQELLEKCEVYSKYVLSRIEDEDEETKKIKEAKLEDRRGSLTQAGKRRSAQKGAWKKAKLATRMFKDEPIPQEQPLILR